MNIINSFISRVKRVRMMEVAVAMAVIVATVIAARMLSLYKEGVENQSANAPTIPANVLATAKTAAAVAAPLPSAPATLKTAEHFTPSSNSKQGFELKKPDGGISV